MAGAASKPRADGRLTKQTGGEIGRGDVRSGHAPAIVLAEEQRAAWEMEGQMSDDPGANGNS